MSLRDYPELVKGHESKRAWSELKREIKLGETSMPDALYDDRCQGRAVCDLLGAGVGWGPQRVWRTLDGLRIYDHDMPIKDLSGPQRRALKKALKEMR